MAKTSIHSPKHPAVIASMKRALATTPPKPTGFEFRTSVDSVNGNQVKLKGDNKDGLPTHIPLRLFKKEQRAQVVAGVHIKITMQGSTPKSAELV